MPSSITSAATTNTVPTQVPTVASSSSASSPSASAPADNTSGGGISSAAIGGLVAMAVIVVIGAGAFFLLRRSRRRNQSKKRATSMSVDPFTMGFGSSQPPTSQAPPPMAAPLQQMYSQPTTPAPPAHDNNTFPPPQVSAIAPVLPPADEPKPVGTYTVISTYTPTLGDELEIQPGDRVEVLVEYDDGWVTGRNISKGGVKGVFPKHCVDYATSPSQHEPTMLDAGGEDLGRTKRISSIYGAQ